jgi:hypothetical protein
MANWAIVLGINKYWNPSANLNGAVNDALEMTRWLTSQNGGNVPPRNLYLLTRPENPRTYPDGTPLQPEIKRYDAVTNNLIMVINEITNKSGGAGERFFFYFSGHGLTNRESFTDEQALIMADFSDVLVNNALTLSSIRNYYKGTHFAEQFFIIDACRNVLSWQKEFTLGRLPLVLPPADNSQFVLFATAPRLRAIEKEAESGERGAFTQVLLKGLSGEGTAKVYDKIMDEYIVRVDRLFKYVEDEIVKQKLLVSKPPEPPFYQHPRKVIDSGGDSPVLAQIDVNDVKAVKLEVYVDPDVARGSAKISILSEDGEYDEEITPVSEVPLKLNNTKPMSYTIRASAAGYVPEKKRWAFDLYEESKQIYVTLNDSPEVPIQDIDNIDLEDDIFRSGNFKDMRGEAKASLKVESSDLLAPLEVTDNSGKLIASGRGSLTAAQLEPGFYRARLVMPEDKVSEQLVELGAGESETIVLDAPMPSESPLFEEIISRTRISVDSDDNSIHISEYIGSIAAPQLTTLLALTGSAVSQSYGWADKSRDLGLNSFQEATHSPEPNGINVIFADEAAADDNVDRLSDIKLRFGRQNETASEAFSLSASTRLRGLASFAKTAMPGAYFLSIEVPGRPPAVFSLAVFSGRVTLLVLQQLIDGSIRVVGFAPAIKIEPAVKFQKDNALDLRRFELLQRYYLSERINDSHAYENAVELLDAKWLDPFAGCLGGYIMLRLNKPDRLSIAAHNMINLYGELSDSHILMADYIKSQSASDAEIKQAYTTAINLGIPVFAEGLEKLKRAVDDYGINHPNASLVNKVFENRAFGTIWNIWNERGGT